MAAQIARQRIILVTVGDPAGVGPELVSQLLLSEQRGPKEFPTRYVIVGDAPVMRNAFELAGGDIELAPVTTPRDALDLPDSKVAVIDLGLLAPEQFEAGKVEAACGTSAAVAVQRAADFVREGEADAIVSAPANKVSMNLAGYHYAGQTEMFLERWNMTPDDAHIMLIGGKIKCSLVTGHCSMAQAIEKLSRERVERIGRQAHATLTNLFGISDPKIGVAGLNCHAGDGGLFGGEEVEIINPAIKVLQKEGMDLTEAQPADALFYDAENGRYDAVLAMYHDQGAIPLKRYGYVTVIGGAPFIRTTCGHGTAFDIAWQNRARPELFLRAAKLASQLATEHS